MVMTAGENNAHFSDVVYNCIYQPYPGFEYSELCATALHNALDYIGSTSADPEQSFSAGHKQTIAKIMDNPRIKNNPNFRLYVLSYAYFFNSVAEADKCNDWSFGYWTHKPKLTEEF
jgi:hypothetical protein